MTPAELQHKLDQIHEEVDPKQYRQQLEEKIKRARKFLNINFVDARALKNRLGASSISEFVDVYKEYKNTDRYEQLEAIVQESLCSKLRAEHFLDIIERIIEMEVMSPRLLLKR
jgi:hypothetical protein